ncbi:hypothetical protein C1H46_029118 [Malus baccata]|uniref:Uncharacterized protein n=1 Tax=Malus baccata TaxID=106549 RepID=A0A540LG52_MALBA|nr:hypothetical protein C1H46_029118 [Malus baccata]
MAGHASSERWIEIGRGRSGDLSAIAADPRFHESGRGGTVREKHGGLRDPQTPREQHRRSRLRRLTPPLSVSGIDRSIRRGSTVLKWYLDCSPSDLSSGKKEPTGLRLDDKREEITLTKPIQQSQKLKTTEKKRSLSRSTLK